MQTIFFYRIESGSFLKVNVHFKTKKVKTEFWLSEKFFEKRFTFKTVA